MLVKADRCLICLISALSILTAPDAGTWRWILEDFPVKKLKAGMDMA